MADKIHVSVIVVTKNAATQLSDCLQSVRDFSEVIIVNSGACSKTRDIAEIHGAQFIEFNWNGQYPKKRQWCLDHVVTRNEWVFFLDADERMTSDLVQEIAYKVSDKVDVYEAAYFVRGQPVFDGKALRFGRWNNKIVLFRKSNAHYPDVGETHIAEMGDVEGHYQPRIIGVVKQLDYHVIHDCAQDVHEWKARHQRYAVWQAAMDKTLMREPGLRGAMKKIFHALPGRHVIAFLDSYLMRLGFCDGRAGLRYALARGWYYGLVAALRRENTSRALDSSVSEKS